MKSTFSIGAFAWLLVACGGSAPPPKPASTTSGYGNADGGSGTASPPVLDAEKVVGRMTADFRKCYSDALASDPKLEGAATFEAKVDAAGNVTAAGPTGATTLPASVTDCISKRVMQAKFAPPGGSGSTLQIPISFKSGS